MKAIIRKELRENLKIGALGLVVFTILAFGTYRYYAGMMEDAALGLRSAGGYSYRLQPLLSSVFINQTATLCGIFAAVLGWMQIHSERHRDLWAFLIHRPLNRSQILMGKVTAGLLIYAAAAGVPLLCFVLWAVTPGHVAAPFSIEMLRPLVLVFLAGVASYFAGMLTGIRQARWYGSRVLGLGMALLIILSTYLPAWSFIQILLIIAVGVALLVTAVWGAFGTQGQYEAQPAPAKAALAFCILPGAVTVLFIVAGILHDSMPDWVNPRTGTNYVMMRNGVLCREIVQAGQPAIVTDLDGNPVKVSVTGEVFTPERVNEYAATTQGLDIRINRLRPKDDIPLTFFNFWGESHGTLWFFWAKYGRLAGFDIVTRRCIGSIGPEGFAPDLIGNGNRFGPNTEYYYLPGPTRTLEAANTIYTVDMQNRAVKPIFKTATDDTVLGKRDIWTDNLTWVSTLVVTRNHVLLVKPDGTVEWNVARSADADNYSQYQVSVLNPPGSYALWTLPNRVVNRDSDWKMATHVTWIENGQPSGKTVDLRPPTNAGQTLEPFDRGMSYVMPAPFWVFFAWLQDRDWSWTIPWMMIRSGLIGAALVWVPAGIWLGRKYRLGFAAQAGWALFILVFNVPGFLTFLSVQEWPVREPCPNCKKLRRVDREHCEHCGAEFAPPEKTGTEIFEPLTSHG